MIGDDNPPCLVCGAEGGNCGPPGDKPRHVLFIEWAHPPGEVEIKEKVTMADQNAVVATERIFEVREIPRTSRTRKILMYAPGQIVPGPDVERLNVRPDGTQGKTPTVEVDTSGAVPLDQKPKARKSPARKTTASKTRAKKTASRKAPTKRKGGK